MPEGQWRIVALGGISQAGRDNLDPIQRVYLRPITEQGSEGPLEHHDLPLGETFDLFSGAGLTDGVLDAKLDGNLRPFSLKVDVTRAAMQIVRRGDRDPRSGEFILPWRTDLSETSDLYMAVLRDAQDRWQAVVPCAELFRFYYLTSSRLGRTILSPNMLASNRILFSENGTLAPDAAGHMKLVVRRGVLPSDVPLIARWIASSGRYGLQAAEQIARHQTLQARSGDFEPVPLRVLPPFEGSCTWSVLGHQVRRGDRMYVFICKLISCDAPFGYETLEWRFDDERAPSDSVNPDPSDIERAKAPKSGVFVDDEPLPFVYLDDDITPTSRFKTRIVPLDDLSKRFPSLNVDGVIRKKPDSLSSRNSKPLSAAVPKTAGALSARAPSGGGDGDAQAVEFTASHPNLAQPGSDRYGDEFSLTPRQALQLVFDICDEIAAREVICRDRADTAGRATLFGRTFNLFPDTIARPRRRFLFMDESRTQPRPIYVAEFEHAKRFGYLLEIPRKPGEKFSTLLFREIRNARIQESILVAVLDEVGKNESVSISEETLNLWGLVAKRAMHLSHADIEQRATDFLAYLNLESATYGARRVGANQEEN